MAVDISMLNENQIEAFNFRKGCCLVLAGPGSGKTKVLSMRIAELIQTSPDEEFSVLCLTFTIKAANEMRSRISELLDNDRTRVEIHTYHSFCTEILRQHGHHLGLNPNFEIIGDEDRLSLLKEVILSLDIPVGYLDGISKILHEIDRYYYVYNTETIQSQNTSHRSKIFYLIFQKYLDILLNNNMLDFGALLYFTRKLLTEHKNLCEHLHLIYEHICVDEFQDTTQIQYEILRLIAPPESANLFVVGDDDQIIFEWNGANINRLLTLHTDYPKMIALQLPENYRCPPEIVNKANLLISNNRVRFSSKIKSMPTKHDETKPSIEVIKYPTFDDEVIGIVKKIKQIVPSERGDCLVISRTNALLKSIEQEFTNEGIDAKVFARKDNFSGAYIQILYYCLKLANNPETRSALNKLYNIAGSLTGHIIPFDSVLPKRKDDFVSPLFGFFSTFESDENFVEISKIGQSNLCNEKIDFLQFIKEYLSYCETIPHIEEIDPEYIDDRNGWDILFEQWEGMKSNNLTLYSLTQLLDLSGKNAPLSPQCIHLQTVHSSKGLEAKYVFLVGMADGVFPSYLALQNGYRAVEEERRNCFVAITRSSQSLYISYADSYGGFKKPVSRFLEEMELI